MALEKTIDENQQGLAFEGGEIPGAQRNAGYQGHENRPGKCERFSDLTGRSELENVCSRLNNGGQDNGFLDRHHER